MDCAKCGGFWVDDGIDARCLNCGSRQSTDTRTVFQGKAITAEELMDTIKKYRGRKPGSKNKPKGPTTLIPPPPPPPPPRVIREGVEVVKPSNGTSHEIDEHHPFVQILAAKWEELEQQIDRLREQQALLKELTDHARTL